MNTFEMTETIYPTRSPPLSPTNPPIFDISRTNSLARMGSELPPLSFVMPTTPYPPPTTPSLTIHTSPSLSSNNNNNNNNNKRHLTINTNFQPTTPSSVLPASVKAFTNNNMNNNGIFGVGNNNSNNNNYMKEERITPGGMDMKEMSLLKWRTGHAMFIVGALLMVLGLCIGLMQAPTTTCKVPYMAYSYYDNYVPYANMECTTHPTGWYFGAPIFGIGALCVGFSWYYSWVKFMQMKMASKYKVAMV